MLELQIIFLLVRFFNRISCNKGLKDKSSCFFTCFFRLTPTEAGMFQNQKDRFVPDVTQAEEYKNMVNVENCQFLNESCEFFISYLSEMKIVCSITLLYSSTFYSLFLPFFVLESFKFKYEKAFVRNFASISKSE